MDDELSMDTDRSLDEVMEAADGLPDDDPDWIDLHWHVAYALYKRFLDESDPDDLDEAIRRGVSVVERQGRSSAAHLHDVALMLWDRFAERDDLEDLARFVELLETALARAEADGTDLELVAECQTNLAVGLMEGTAADVPEPVRARAVSLWEAALASGQLDEDAERWIEGNLTLVLSHAGASEADLRRVVELGRRAAAEATDPEDAAIAHFNLAASLESLHDSVVDDGLLEEAIEHVRVGLDLLGADHRDHPGYTANLVNLLQRLSRERGDPALTNEAVDLGRAALRRIPDDDLDRPLVLTATASAICEAVRSDADLGLLSEALDLYRTAIEITPEGSQDRGVAMVNLVSACRDANERYPDPALLTEALVRGDEALKLFSAPGLYRAATLTAVSNAQRDRYLETGSLDDLDEARSRAEEALDLTPEQHSERAARLTNLAVILSDDFTERSDRSRLDRAIQLYRQALELREPVASRVVERMNDLALALRDRYRDTENSQDLNEAVDLARQTVAASKTDELTHAGYVNNLANALSERYERDGDPEDLVAAIERFGEALAVAANRPVEASGYATNLGLSLAARAQNTGSMDDMDQALLHLERSIDLLPTAHQARAHRISNLSDVYRQRSVMLMERGNRALALENANRAVTTGREAVEAAGSSDARLLPALSNLAEALRWRERLTPGSSPSREVLENQRRAALLEEITPAEKFGQSVRWARDAEALGDREEAFLAFGRAVSLTTQVAWIGLTLGERRELLTYMREVLDHAVAHAAGQRRLEAFAWADHVRSVLWRQGLQTLSLAAERGDEQWASLSGFVRHVQADGRRPSARPDEQLRLRAHAAAAALGQAVPDPDAYRGLGAEGPVVLLVPGDEESLALVLQGLDEPLEIRLPEASAALLREWGDKLRTEMTHGVGTFRSASHVVFECLEWLWVSVASPILDRIATTGERPHVWWSPVGEFALLPVHAAGVHPRNKPQAARRLENLARWPSVQDRAFSSYLPTVRRVGPRPGARDGHLDAVLHVSVDVDDRLGSLEAERRAVNEAMQGARMTRLFDDHATVAAFRAELPKCTLLHVSAHGRLDPDDTFEAGIELADGRFTLRDLAASRTATGRLAVLLTCESASGDFEAPDEALHAAGAAQQAGFAEVVAATLPVRDSSVVPFVTCLYAAVAAEPTDGDFASAVARAVADAVDELRLDPRYAVDPLSWVPYAHFSGYGR
ncbi:CHAT domain-containing protein [Actinomyces qiguomingii]|uniref:CHAT domain-containing protein n=1 Tax=Actinomyces qiguomingii TaxID=2057800 RepID=UPI000CA02583|nr:CHAT domain-containing protein [Actinomyces qiguomingii]